MASRRQTIVSNIERLVVERDVRFYDDTRITFKGRRSAGEMVRDFATRQPLLDETGAAAFVAALREYVIPVAPDADLYRIYEGLKDCPRVQS